MGAKNYKAALRLYAGKVPPPSLLILTYMAMTSKDADAEPWWSEGHQALATKVLGRAEADDEKAKRANEMAVERAITPLYRAGAISCTRHSSARDGVKILVRYRLHLTPAQEVSTPRKPYSAQPSSRGEHPTETVRAPHGNRGTKEEERNIHTDQDHEDHDLFEFFWEAYPRQTGKPAAERAWVAAVGADDPDHRPDLIIDCARQYAKDIAGSDPRFIMGAARWLTEENWLDHLPCVKVQLGDLSRTG